MDSDTVIKTGVAIIIVWLVAVTALMVLPVVSADTLDLVPHDRQVLRGTFDLRNSTVTKASGANETTVVLFSLNSTYEEYVHFVDCIGLNLTLYEDRAYVTSVVIPTTDWYLNSTGSSMDFWLMLVSYSAGTIDLYYSSSSMPSDVADVIDPTEMGTYYLNYWSVLAYGFMLLFPASIWLRYKSEGGAGITLLLISAVGTAIDTSLLPMATLICGVALGTIIFRAWWMKRTGSD